jgi:hypothetical protein
MQPQVRFTGPVCNLGAGNLDLGGNNPDWLIIRAVVGSLRSEPRRIRAERMATLPVVRARRPRYGRYHPTSTTDIRRALTTFGPEIYYAGSELRFSREPVGRQ